eukprot:scaffold57471_cov33-Attheya_sp.AAC.1
MSETFLRRTGRADNVASSALPSVRVIRLGYKTEITGAAPPVQTDHSYTAASNPFYPRLPIGANLPPMMAVRFGWYDI